MLLTPSTLAPPSALGSPPGQLLLRLRGSDGAATVVRLSAAKCSVGSGPGCTLRLRGPGIRPLHCLILRGSGSTVVRRWDARTRLDGAAFDVAELRAGSRLALGTVEIEVLDLAHRPDAGSPQVQAPADARALPPSTFATDEPQRDQVLWQLDATRRELDDARRRLDEVRREKALLIEQLETYRGRAEAQQREHDERQRQWEQWRCEADQRRESLDGQRHALESERRAVENLRAELDDRRRELDDRQRELDDARARLEEQRAQLDAERQAWLDQRRQSDQQDESRHGQPVRDELHQAAVTEELRRRQAELDALEEQSRRRAAELDARAASLETRRAELHAEAASLETRRAELDARSAELKARSDDLDARSASLSAREAELEAKSTELESRCAQFAPATERPPEQSPIQRHDDVLEAQSGARHSDSPVDLASLFERIGVRPPTADDDEGDVAPAGSDRLTAGRSGPRALLGGQTARESADRSTAAHDGGDPGHDEADEQHEESINDYMARLMERVRSMAGGSRTAAATPSQPAPPGQRTGPPRGASESDENRSLVHGQPARRASPPDADPRDDARPRAVAAEKLSGLSAMRELANLSAQAAINTHARKKLVAVRRAKAAVATVGLLAGVFLLRHWRLHPEHLLAFYGGLIGCVVALIWAVQYAVLAGHLYLDRRGRLGLKLRPIGQPETDASESPETSVAPTAASSGQSAPPIVSAAAETADAPRVSADVSSN